MDTNLLVKKFADAVEERWKALDEGKIKKGNSLELLAYSIFKDLLLLGDSGRAALAVLLDDERREVRVTAAAYLLRYCESRAKAILEKESKEGGFLATNARWALQHWRDGTWNHDPG